MRAVEGRRLWFVGIGGAGLSAYAAIASAWGAEIGGWDRVDTPYLDKLREHELVIAPDPVVPDDWEVVVSTAYAACVDGVYATRQHGRANPPSSAAPASRRPRWAAEPRRPRGRSARRAACGRAALDDIPPACTPRHTARCTLGAVRIGYPTPSGRCAASRPDTTRPNAIWVDLPVCGRTAGPAGSEVFPMCAVPGAP